MNKLPEFIIVEQTAGWSSELGFYYFFPDNLVRTRIGPFESRLAAVLAMIAHTAETYFTEEDKENE